jgi:hypothetical protein
VLLEVIRKVALVDEARHRRRDRWDRSVSEKLPSPLDAYLNQVLMRRQSSRFPKCTNDPEGCHPGPLREHVQGSFVAFGVGILEQVAYDTHEARLAQDSAFPIQGVILRGLMRMAAYQFCDCNADRFLGGCFIEIKDSIRAMRSVSGTVRVS